MHQLSRPPHVVVLSGAQTIAAADATQAMLLGALHAHGEVALDCRAVDTVDVAFVQLLIAAQRFAAEHGIRFGLAVPPPPLAEVLTRGGFAPLPLLPVAAGEDAAS